MELSEIHKRCDSVILRKLKISKLISKRAAVEKEPLTLEKDKEDQSKYYLSYSMPPVLDMMWQIVMLMLYVILW